MKKSMKMAIVTKSMFSLSEIGDVAWVEGRACLVLKGGEKGIGSLGGTHPGGEGGACLALTGGGEKGAKPTTTSSGEYYPRVTPPNTQTAPLYWTSLICACLVAHTVHLDFILHVLTHTEIA